TGWVFIGLGAHPHRPGGGWASIETLMRELGVLRGTLVRALREVESKGLGAVQRRGTEGEGRLLPITPGGGAGGTPGGAVGDTPRVSPVIPRGVTHETSGASRVTPKLEPVNKHQEQEPVNKPPLTPPGGFPGVLDTKEFASKWQEWLEYRKARRL